MRRVLLTGFEPFGVEPVNPSLEVLRELQNWRPATDAVVHTLELPCVFGLAIDLLQQAMDQLQPDVVISLGLAANRGDVTVERVAINVDDARIPDNAGEQPVDEPVVAGAPAAYFSTLPIKAIVAALRAAGIPAAVSQTAGTFVCNHVFYGLAHAVATRHAGVRGGFIHLPRLPSPPEQAEARPGPQGLPLTVQVRAVQIAVQTTLATERDLRIAAGSVD